MLMRHFASITLALALAILFCPGATRAAECPTADPDVVCTVSGAIRGTREGSTLAFKGIPYAQAPVGPLRWRPPVEAVAWEGIRAASDFGPICPQIVSGQVVGSEDCLTLNIWRPRDLPATQLPVMVWVTGGGNHSLSGKGSAGFGGVSYDGETLVERGVVYVSYNLRLGVLGFLAHPALDAERAERISGNYGSLDQIAMLRWLGRNVGAFGGDPSRVFLFGTSAGGGNICALMTSPLARGLFHGAAMQSSVPIGCEIQTLADAQSGTGRRVVKALGCDAAPDVAACLRTKDVGALVKAVPGTFGVLPRVYGPNADGHVFPDQPLKLIRERKHRAMPVIIGSTSEETMPWVNSAGQISDPTSYTSAIEKAFGPESRDAIAAQYPVSAYPNPGRAFMTLTTDALFTCQSRRVARTMAAAQTEPIYRYIFAHSLQHDPNGASHTVEHPFFFGWRGTYRPTETDLGIQRRMINYWTRMARVGNPNSEDGPRWPAHVMGNDPYLEIGPMTIAKMGPSSAKCDFWDAVRLPWPHL
jgi:para-nitrobenzyl esterase